MRIIAVFLIGFCVLNLKGQYFSDVQVSKDELSPWVVGSAEIYEGEYHFGYSEEEGKLRLIIDDTVAVAQAVFQSWRDQMAWVDTFYTFTNVRVQGRYFYSDETNGEFLTFPDFPDVPNDQPGLLVYKPWAYEFYPGGEFVLLDMENVITFSGLFPEASARLLTEAELAGRSKKDLRLMRNEIYARYGYIFKVGGDMDLHFTEQDWYRPVYREVEQWFTKIEKHNIRSIQKAEKG